MNSGRNFGVTDVTDKVLSFIIIVIVVWKYIYNTIHKTHNANICYLVIIKAAVPVRDDTKYTHQFGS